jgi:hypothetical protein
MADQRAWWTLVISHEPDGPHDHTIKLSDADTAHIRIQIAEGFNQGWIVADPPGDYELVWQSAGTDEPGDQYAESVWCVDPRATSAYYSLCFAPSEDGRRWSLELIQTRKGDEIGTLSLGRHLDEEAAKEYARQWEHRADRTPPAPDPHLTRT